MARHYFTEVPPLLGAFTDNNGQTLDKEVYGMKQTLVSIIMAVYNAEPYLHRCLDSIQAQTLMDFDVILVDDGSTDYSLAIAEEYAQGDSRFRVYHKDNGGVSSARQYGIERLAEKGGKYSIHVDPDDWVEPQMLERLYRKAEDTEADMVICDYYQNLAHKQLLQKQDPRSEDPHDVLNALFQKLHGSLCNKLIRSNCYKEADIRFPDGLNYCEDFYVNVCLLQKSIKKVAYLSEAFYHYDNYSNQQAETKITDRMHITKTRKEIVRLCRETVPDNHKGWQFRLFETKKAFCIMKDGCMRNDDWKEFFSALSYRLLLKHHFWRPYLLTTLVAVKTPVSCQKALKLFYFYQKLVYALRGRSISTEL